MALFVLVSAFLWANGSAEAEGGKEAVGEQQFKLSISINQPPSSPLYTEGWIPFVEKLGERTDGRVEATLYHSNSLIPIKEAYDGVTNGLADIAYCMPSQSPGRFPLSSFIELPFMGTSSTSASRIANELFDTYPELQAEFKDTHVLFFWAAEPAGISTSKVPVRTMEDLKGLKIGGPPSAVAIMKALGASPMVGGPGDRYNNLQTDIYDGICMGLYGVTSWNLHEVSKYHTDAQLFVANSVTVMNLNTWNSLPADVQNIVAELSAELQQKLSEIVDKQHDESVQIVESNGGEFIELTDNEMAEWVKAAQPIWDTWIRDMESKGLPGKKLVEEAGALASQYR